MDCLKVAGSELKEFRDAIHGAEAVTILSHNTFFTMAKKRKTILKSIGIIFLKVIFLFAIVSFFQVLFFKLIDPFTSSVMLQRNIVNITTDSKIKPVRYEWYDYDQISKNLAIAVVAAEDQNFPFHIGFDFEQIGRAISDKSKGKRLRGASTITQQVAKNLFLWEGKSFIRKGLEAYYTILIEFLWSKRRTLEIYLNIAEMGNNIFGAGAVSKLYFHKKPKLLTKREAALIAAILPNPHRFSVVHPTQYVLERQKWILKQMKSLGGVSYLKNL